jgi:hypothetical protein
MNYSKDTLLIAGVIFAAVYMVAVLVFFMFRQYLRFKEKELEFKVHMSPTRAHLESELVELNKKYLSSEAQWKDANHLVLASQAKSIDIASPSHIPTDNEFLLLHGIKGDSFKTEKNLVFVLTPFLGQFSDTYEQIQQVCASLGLKCLRGDEDYVRGEIFPHILKQIVKARFIVANITGRNPNVFYELGIAHALDKPVIMIAKQSDDIPFDVRTKNVILYNNDEDLAMRLKDALLKVSLSESV